MTKVQKSLTAGLTAIAIAASPLVRAEERDASPALAPNAMVERLLKAAAPGEPLVELRGYVGPAPADQLRLYESLDLAAYVDVARTAVVTSSLEEGRKDEAVRVLVRASAPIVRSTRQPAGTLVRGRGRGARGGGNLLKQAPYCGSVGQVCAGNMLMEVYECAEGLSTENYYVQVGSC